MCDTMDSQTLDGFTITPTSDAHGYEVTVTRRGAVYAWLHTFSTRDYARQCCQAVAPWPIAWAELEAGVLVGTKDATIGARS